MPTYPDPLMTSHTDIILTGEEMDDLAGGAVVRLTIAHDTMIGTLSVHAAWPGNNGMMFGPAVASRVVFQGSPAITGEIKDVHEEVPPFGSGPGETMIEAGCPGEEMGHPNTAHFCSSGGVPHDYRNAPTSGFFDPLNPTKVDNGNGEPAGSGPGEVPDETPNEAPDVAKLRTYTKTAFLDAGVPWA